jgi:hypothetical protein
MYEVLIIRIAISRKMVIILERKFVNVQGDQESIPAYLAWRAEPVFLNVYEAQESIPRNEFRQPM